MEETPRFGQPGWRLGQTGVVVIALVAAAMLFTFSFTAGWGARALAQHAARPRYAMMQGEFGRPGIDGRGYMRQPGDRFGPGAPGPRWDERGCQRGPGW